MSRSQSSNATGILDDVDVNNISAKWPVYSRAISDSIIAAVGGQSALRRLVVTGYATSGMAYNNYSPYGYGAYGSVGYGYQQQQPADLSFRCDVDYRGYVRNVDINRR